MAQTQKTARNSTTLTWGIKESFRQYIANLPDGRQALENGVTLTEDGRYIFTSNSEICNVDHTNLNMTVKFQGFLRFRGHLNLLLVILNNPWLQINNRKAYLSIENPFEGESDTRITVAKLELPAPVKQHNQLTWTGAYTYLTSQGAPVFNDVYPVGEVLDPIDFSISVNQR